MLNLNRFLDDALHEDIGHGDITTNATVAEDAHCHARLMAKQNGVLSGIEVFRRVFERLNADVTGWTALEDGARFNKGDCIASFDARTRAVLTGERVALNLVQRMTGIATLTAAYVQAVDGYDVRICETRKSMPLLRSIEKMAVRHGGGQNHRYALFDGVLIKENHIVAAGGITAAIEKAMKGAHHLLRIGVEVKHINELDEAVAAGAESILLDNMSVEEMRAAVEHIGGHHVLLEASGNITLERVRDVAKTGVNLISIGALTHSAPAVDVSLLIENA